MIMEFRTRLVVSNKNKRAVVAYVGLGISACSMLLVFFRSLEDYVPWVFGAGVVVILVGAIWAKGKIAAYVLSEEELVVSTAAITIADRHYPLAKLSSLDINVEVYAGMLTEAWGMPKDAISDGMGNDLSFRWQGSKVSCRYYLNSRQHILQLAGVLTEFYEAHIPFIERRGSVRTYLLQQLDEAQLTEFKKKYGYA
jgi:hypothetical protein